MACAISKSSWLKSASALANLTGVGVASVPPAAQRLHEPAAFRLRHVGIAAVGKRLGGHIARPAVGKRRHDPHLLPRADLLHHGIARENVDLHHARRGQIELRAVGDPRAQDVVILFAQLRPLPALVRHARRRLEQHQRVIRRRHVQPPPREIVLQRAHIENWIVAAQRKLEAELAVLRTVTRPRVAPQPRHHRVHIADEIHRLIFHHTTHFHRHHHLLPRDFHRQRGHPIRPRRHPPALGNLHAIAAQPIPRQPRHIRHRPIRQLRRHHHLRALIPPRQHHLHRLHIQPPPPAHPRAKPRAPLPSPSSSPRQTPARSAAQRRAGRR